ncbi:valyl-tRNA synthetase [Isosphaera pallida ATCC 43644]|uniref:Valine--tRNA ligase n=1 Tax=Isosphaera pallida (strain ATCC 43644 / DSM 9630 / IS1B) TaxID=575540 RepID=E8R5F2_ISOPI|nr:valine--tRNA ligase [Isosphaera pallida]ADV60693.1 valyl-tRNA synthetase [Isosphaera pallida ATCC 43644]
MSAAAELPKQYDPRAAQERWYPFWLEQGYFQADPASSKPPYVIVIPPPNVTGALHLGHALNNTIQDILIRWRRAQGYDALWLPGTDHAGIATQAVVEKRLFQEEKKTRHDLGRDELVRRIWAWKEEYEARILNQLQRMGCSCDWSRTRFTLDEQCARAVRVAFFRLFEAGLIYRGKRLVNWDTHLQTAVADDEITYSEVQSSIWTIAYPLADDPTTRLQVATTRPETMLGDTAVAVHPEDERYRHLIGRSVRLPLLGRTIPIIADGLLVDPSFGTGVVKVTPAHDPNDYQTGLRHNLPMINLLNPDGTSNTQAGPYAGLPWAEVRKRVVADLEAQGLLVAVQPHLNRVGFSDRSATPIEPYLSDQWFVAMSDLAQRAMDAVTSGQVRFHPERYAKSYLDWLGEKRDWCISRQLWWGHRIPIWTCDQPDVTEEELRAAFGERSNLRWHQGEDGRWLICALEDLSPDALPGRTLTQDPDVLDTWFSSALWPHSTLGWPEATEDLKKYYPTSVLSTARDIITLWVARMVMFGQFNLNEVPFRDVYIHPVIQDGQGRRMSKSLGNGIDPVDVIELYGADALRFTLASSATETQDLRMPVEQVQLPDGRKVNTSERFEQGRTFPNKFWNAARFALMNLEGHQALEYDRASLPVEDRWILSLLARASRTITADLEAFRFAEMAKTTRDFIWGDFCDWYLELVKGRLRNPETRPTAQRVLAGVLDQLCRLIQPMMPFVAEQVWQALGNLAPERSWGGPTTRAAASVCVAPWPEWTEEAIDPAAEAVVERWREVIRTLRHLRSEREVPEAAKIAPVLIASASVAVDLERGRSLIAALTNASDVMIVTPDSPHAVKPKEAAVAVLAEIEVVLPLEGLIDREAERQRQLKTLADLDKQLQAIRAKLNNAGFVERAPANVVQAQRDREAELLARKAAVEALLK